MQKLKSFLDKNRNLVMLSITFLGMMLICLVNGISFSIKGTEIINNFSVYSVIFTGRISVGDYIFEANVGQIVLLISLISMICSFAFIVLSYFVPKIVAHKTIIRTIFTSLICVASLVILLSSRIIQASASIYEVDGLKIKANMNRYFSLFYIAFLVVYLAVCFSELFEIHKYSVREISETAILIALAIVLDQFGAIRFNATGGSINFSAIPLIIIGIRYGFFKGFVASSIIFGVVTCLLDGYGFITYPFDYLIAFAGYGLVSVFYNFALKIGKKTSKSPLFFGILGVILGYIPMTLVRYIGTMCSGYFLYETPFVENFLYQTTYVPLSALVSIAGVCVLLPVIMMLEKMYPAYQKTEVKNDEESPKN